MKLTSTALAALFAITTNALADNEYSDEITNLADTTISRWISAPTVLDAVRAQNTQNASLAEDQIADLDATWRQQVISGGALIDDTLTSPLSEYLKELKAQGAGRFTEIFVTDNRGLNVGQSDITSDYWQGDEAKWQVPHDTLSIHIGDIEFDESSQTYQSQVSLPIIDAGEFIGAITVGINMERLTAAN